MLSRLDSKRRIDTAARQETIEKNTSTEIGKIAEVVCRAYERGALRVAIPISPNDHTYLYTRIRDSTFSSNRDEEHGRICQRLIQETGGAGLLTCSVVTGVTEGDCHEWSGHCKPNTYDWEISVSFIDK